MDSLTVAADLSIRRACGFAGLAIACVMLALTFDLALALRIGGDMVGLLCLGLLFAAWRAPRRDLRHSEVWSLLPETADAARLRQGTRDERQTLLSAVLRARLMWHAERIGAVAVGLWAAAWGVLLLSWLFLD